MRVLLRSDIDGVGKRGDVVEVAKGFARNYLFPTGRALAATSGMDRQASAMRRARDLRDARDREAAVTVSEALASTTINVTARAGAGGRLFGSVTTSDIASALEAQTGAVVDRRKIHLAEPIKSLGTHVVPVALHSDVQVEMTVEVIAST
ncbi:MAG TPA: 50S ribosomal protein L9 [Acidimicrobiales bacterium]|nr:50S ribosomal protein L9 [Acidimicrobiales bacterium]